MLKCAVFDFDDTIVMSEVTKRQLWYDILDKKYESAITEVFRTKTFTDRYDLAIYLSNISGLSTHYLLELYAHGLSDFFLSRSAHVAGVTEFLNHLTSKGVASYINSATPIAPLELAVEQSGLGIYFEGVYGNPKSKAPNLRKAMSHAGASVAETIMVGDSVTDLNGAMEIGCQFIGVDFDDTGKLSDSDCVVFTSYDDVLVHIVTLFDLSHTGKEA